MIKKLRTDGRKLGDQRNLKISFGKGSGEVEISLGNTIVIARTMGKITKPRMSRDREGYLRFNVDLSTM